MHTLFCEDFRSCLACVLLFRLQVYEAAQDHRWVTSEFLFLLWCYFQNLQCGSAFWQESSTNVEGTAYNGAAVDWVEKEQVALHF